MTRNVRMGWFRGSSLSILKPMYARAKGARAHTIDAAIIVSIV